MASDPTMPTIDINAGHSVLTTQAPPDSLVSIVVPCCGQLEYTRLCLQSLFARSRLPCEFIFLDIGSMDGTADFLDGVALAAQVRVEVIHARDEARFQEVARAGLALAQGEFVVWLSNDTVVTDCWLEQLVAVASLYPEIGAVGPMSNRAPGVQRVSPAPYRVPALVASADTPHRPKLDVTALDRFAWDWRENQRGKWHEVDRLGGFCLLMKREVLVQLSPVEDMRDGFNTDAYCHRLRAAGVALALCGDLFIHHFGTRLVA